MNTHLLAALFLTLLVVGGLAVVAATLRMVRRDRPAASPAWTDWRETALHRNLRIS
jgi:hypothetical protein